MSVIRVKHQANYVVILNNTVLTDPNLTFKAKGLWAYCMSRPDDWEFNVNHLMTVSKEGKDAIYSAINELVDAGYITKIQNRDKGKFLSYDYEVSEIKIILPQRENPLTENPLVENPPLVSIDSSANLDKELNLEESSQVFKDAEILRKMSLEINDIKSGNRSYEKLSEDEVINILNTYSHEEIHKSGKNCANRKNNKRNKLGPIQSEKAYFFDSLKKVKNGVYKL